MSHGIRGHDGHPALAYDADLAAALSLLRERRAQLGVLRDDSGRLLGLVSRDDLLERITTDQPAQALENLIA